MPDRFSLPCVVVSTCTLDDCTGMAKRMSVGFVKNDEVAVLSADVLASGPIGLKTELVCS